MYINGKFMAQRVTGVQRFAREMTKALDNLLIEQSSERKYVLLTPPEVESLGLRAIEQRDIAFPLPGLHAWEQLVLPWVARHGYLLNLTGSAPFWHSRQIASILDTAIYEFPEAYTRGFRIWYRRLFARQARHARVIVTLTEFSRKRLVEMLRPRVPVVVVGAAAGQFGNIVADIGAIERSGLDARPFMLAVGSANPTKNFTRLLEAFARVRDPQLRLAIVGGGNSSVFADNEIERNDRIVRLGVVSDPELKALYMNARGFIFPSIYEGFGLPPLEAMACSCPVAASTSASIPEVCGGAAIYFDPYDVEAITASIELLAGDEALRSRLIVAGQARTALYSWDRSATGLLSAINAHF